jgi:hypothetical protein
MDWFNPSAECNRSKPVKITKTASFAPREFLKMKDCLLSGQGLYPV